MANDTRENREPREGGARPFQKPGGRPQGGPGGGRFGGRKGGLLKRKRCRFCADKIEIDYKNINLLRGFVTERGKILSGHVTGNCAKHQRELATAVKRARMIALLPFSVI
jgi:small subunit ribosomal protein S18